MKLYRIDTKAHDVYDGSYTGGLPDPISFLIDDGVLVPVEPEETIKWCFAHHRNWWGSNGCGFRTRREGECACDRGTAVIVRIEG